MKIVADIMSIPVFTLSPTDTLSDVRTLMSLENIRHIPVTDDEGNFEGLITHRDVLSCTISMLADIEKEVQDELDDGIIISEIMRKDVCCVGADMLLKEAALILYKNKYGCLPVLKGKQLVGIITEADFLRLSISLLEKIGE